jgi:hypothetical protein
VQTVHLTIVSTNKFILADIVHEVSYVLCYMLTFSRTGLTLSIFLLFVLAAEPDYQIAYIRIFMISISQRMCNIATTLAEFS